MVNPLISQVFSGVGISSAGLALQIQNINTKLVVLTVDTKTPLITVNAPLTVGTVIIDDLTVNTLVIGNPPTTIATALEYIYDNDAGTEPQLVIEQAGTGDVGLEFLLSGGTSYSVGIDNSETNDPFKIAYAGAGGPPVFGTNDILLVDHVIHNIGLGLNALGSITSLGSNNVAVGAGALENLDTGTDNIALGEGSGDAYTGAESNNICIGNTGVLGESGVAKLGTSGVHTTYLVGATFLGGSLSANTTLTTEQSGSWFRCAQGVSVVTITLPTGADVAGTNYKFILTTTSTANFIIAGGAGTLFGVIVENDATPVVQISSNTSIVYRGGPTAASGDIIEVYGIDSSHWMVKGYTSVAAGIGLDVE